MKLLAISWASHTSVNRQIFRVLNEEKDLEVKIIFPKNVVKNGLLLNCDPYTNEPMECSSLNISSSNPRYNRYIGVFKLINSFDPDIIFHEDDPISFQAIQYGVWCFIHNKKLICRTNQNVRIKYCSEIKRLGFLKGIFYTAFKHLIFKISKIFVSHIFTINNEGESIFKELGFKNLSKIPVGLDEKVFKIDLISRERIRKQLNLEGVVFAYIGRIIEGKGLHTLVKALSNILDHDWSILIDSFQRAKQTNYENKIIELLDSTGVRERVVYFEANHFEIAEYMNAADVVVVPSVTTKNFKEQYGRVGPEAMACGCLVITSNCGALPEVVGPQGWVFEENNIQALTRLLFKTLDTKHPKGFSEDLSRYAHKNLGVSAQKKIILDVISDLQ